MKKLVLALKYPRSFKFCKKAYFCYNNSKKITSPEQK